MLESINRHQLGLPGFSEKSRGAQWSTALELTLQQLFPGQHDFWLCLSEYTPAKSWFYSLRHSVGWVVDTLVVSSKVILERIEAQFCFWLDVHSVGGRREEEMPSSGSP